MSNRSRVVLHSEVAEALASGQPVVALESTLIAHGLPWPLNLETALAAEQVVRDRGAIPATIAVLRGVPTIGLGPAELEALATSGDTLKASTRDLAAAIAKGRTAATTVSATMRLAHAVSIRLFATGGIGGAHRGNADDVSADLMELARTPVGVVCAGAKSILDLRRTLEILETEGVPVVGYRTSTFPAFYLRSCGEPVAARVETPAEAADLFEAHWSPEGVVRGAGIVLAQPLPAELELSEAEFNEALHQAEAQATTAGIRGQALTPFLLARLAELTRGRSLQANRGLIVANAALAAEVAVAFAGRVPLQRG